jgi:hypothetical protein
MKKLIKLSLIFVFFFCQHSYARDLAAKYEKELLREIKKYSEKIEQLKCHEFEKMSQKQLNKCNIYAITFLHLELTYSDFIQEMMADNFDMSTKDYAKKKPRNFYDK